MIYYQENERGLWIYLQADVQNQDGISVLPSGRTEPLMVGFVGDPAEIEDCKLLVEDLRKRLGLSKDRRLSSDRRKQNYPISIERRADGDRRSRNEVRHVRRESNVG